MSRYIDADLLQEDFKEDHGGKRSLMIDTQPTADVRENVRGKWLHKKTTDDYHVTGQCSNCHERRRIDNFCPNCGAQMIRGES